ncbi:hypothetical protein EW146_g5521 [Bondarzewia mesenterica]|uniref:MBOAT-domain-containing protein n=1 Tax=Bondarzewia mesenterica TaxID=1095465 RepID=A0A4S4LTB5_9AGAM|nr:hypothetical protein EW146_g5521 [Bondarzewia mesenterica]
MDFLFVPLAASVGASVDQVKLIACLLVSYPLGSLFIRIPSSRPALKHLFNLSIAFFYFIPVLNLRVAFLQLLGDVLATYFVTANVKGSHMPWIVFTFGETFMTFLSHVIRAMFAMGYETFDVTGPQMVLIMKLTTFAWNVYDGRRPAEVNNLLLIFSILPTNGHGQDLDRWQLQMKVSKFPSLLEFLGYAFYFPGVLVGPYLEYAAYSSLIDETLFKSYESNATDDSRGNSVPQHRKRAIPDGRKRVAYRKGLWGLLYLGLFMAFSPSFYFGITITDWFAKQGLLYRIIYLQFCGFIERAKYYGIWILTEGASILTGLGFTGYGPSGKSLWEGAANVNVRLIEFPPNFKVLLDSWNMKTNVWLRECMYKRVTPKGKKPGFKSSMITFATSAFWHGVAGGYYLTFILGGFVQTAGRLCRTHIRPLVMSATVPALFNGSNGSPATIGAPAKSSLQGPKTTIKKLYDVLSIVVSILLVNYATVPFMLLNLKDSIDGWSHLAWYGHWMIGLCLLFFYAGGRRWLKKIQARRVQKASAGSSSDDLNQIPNSIFPPVDSAAQEIEKRLD